MRVKRFPKYTMLLVVWQDIVSDSSWNDKEAIEKAGTAEIKTVGFFLQNKKQTLKIAHSIADDGASDYTVIPWACVVKVEELNHVCHK